MYLRVDAQPLGQRDAVLRQALAHLVRRRERVLGRDVVAVARQAAEVGRARRDELRPPVRDGSAAPGCRRRASAAAPRRSARLHVLERDRRRPRPAAAVLRRDGAGPCASSARRPRSRCRPAPRRSSCRCGTKFWRMTSCRCPCSACTAASALSAPIRSSAVSPMPTRIPRVNGIFSSPAARIVCRRSCGSFVGEPWWATRSSRDRLEHQPLRRRDLAQPRQLLARQRAEVRVRQQPALERPLARPHDVGDEVLEAELREPGARRRRGELGLVAGEDQQLLDVATRRTVERGR